MVQNFGAKNVISMMHRRAINMYPALAIVEAYWHGLCDGTAIPSRSSIDPRGLEDALEYAFILERIAPGIGRFRLAGMHLNDLMGMEVRGMPMSAMFIPAARDEIIEAMEKVCADPQIITLTLKSKGGIGRPALEAQMVLTPLVDEMGDVTRVLGALQSKGNLGRQPRRWDIVEQTSTKVGVPETTPSFVPPVYAPNPAPAVMGFREEQTPFIHKSDSKKPDAKRPALRIVSSND